MYHVRRPFVDIHEFKILAKHVFMITRLELGKIGTRNTPTNAMPNPYTDLRLARFQVSQSQNSQCGSQCSCPSILAHSLVLIPSFRYDVAHCWCGTVSSNEKMAANGVNGTLLGNIYLMNSTCNVNFLVYRTNARGVSASVPSATHVAKARNRFCAHENRNRPNTHTLVIESCLIVRFVTRSCLFVSFLPR